jgi:hypothetical protein
LPKATRPGQTNRTDILKHHLLFLTIDVVHVDTVRSTVYVKLDQIFPRHARQLGKVMAPDPRTVAKTIMEEIDPVGTDTAEVHHRITDAEVKEMIIIETTRVTETGATMITTTMWTEAVQGATAEIEAVIGDGKAGAIERKDQAGIGPEIGMRRVETDLETGSEIETDRGQDPGLDHDLDQETDLVKDPGRGLGIEIGVDLAIGLEIETDLVTEETGTVKIIDLVDAVAKVRTTGVMTMEKKET